LDQYNVEFVYNFCDYGFERRRLNSFQSVYNNSDDGSALKYNFGISCVMYIIHSRMAIHQKNIGIFEARVSPSFKGKTNKF
jgi:hypothetical protein